MGEVEGRKEGGECKEDENGEEERRKDGGGKGGEDKEWGERRSG